MRPMAGLNLPSAAFSILIIDLLNSSLIDLTVSIVSRDLFLDIRAELTAISERVVDLSDLWRIFFA